MSLIEKGLIERGLNGEGALWRGGLMERGLIEMIMSINYEHHFAKLAKTGISE